MRKILLSLLTLSLFHSFTCKAQTLCDAYQDLWLTGVSVNQWEVTPEKGIDQTADWKKIVENFDCVVAENCMKCEVTHPSEGIYDFTLADQFVDKAVAAGLKVHGHCLIWHSQCAKWFHFDKEGKLVSPEVLKKRMKEYIYTVVSHFKGRVKSWDVCNECFEDDGTPRKSLFYQILGTDYIPLAFRYAHEADPDAELYYNDFSMNKATKVEAVADFFCPLIKQGLPVDAIGFQGHMILEDGTDLLKQYDHSLDVIASLGVKSFFSELDLTVLPNPYGFSGANISDNFKYTPDKDPFRNGLAKEKEKEIADYWVNFYKLMLKHRDVINRLGFWGFNDNNSWRNDFPIKGRTDYATLFDRNNQPKPFIKDLVKLRDKK